MTYSYEITRRAAELGGGWRLQLLQDDVEMGGGVFPMLRTQKIRPTARMPATTKSIG